MRTLLLEPPAEVEAWLARRRELGQDRFDEVWDGEYHVAPGPHFAHGEIGGQVFRALFPSAEQVGLRGGMQFNLGGPSNYRVPDLGFVRSGSRYQTYMPTAAVVVEVVSPGDETYAKFGFYFEHGVEELLVVDPVARTVEWFRRGAAAFEAVVGSTVLDVTAAQLAAQIDWPEVSAN